ncbi:hypothetical protein GQ44DRAFT_261866 [Phaeosphaeriaceae sp. PMI808]|nr:hypothetical protein GQ44DRAFT_261866 [Phaeosphaeriaceae sp. PMI808]
MGGVERGDALGLVGQHLSVKFPLSQLTKSAPLPDSAFKHPDSLGSNMAAPSSPLFKLTVKIDKSMLPYLHEKKIRLCSAFGATTNLTDEHDLSWLPQNPRNRCCCSGPTPTSSRHATMHSRTVVSRWRMCPTTGWLTSRHADKALPNTNPLDVLPGAALALDAAWTDPLPMHSSASAPDGFTLLSRASAVAMLLQRVRESFVPIYVTSTGPHLPPPNCRQIMRPNGTVVVFLMRGTTGGVFDLKEAVSEGCVVQYRDELKSNEDNVSDGLIEFGKDGWRDAPIPRPG